MPINIRWPEPNYQHLIILRDTPRGGFNERYNLHRWPDCRNRSYLVFLWTSIIRLDRCTGDRPLLSRLSQDVGKGSGTMRKVIEQLDSEERQALREWVDLGIAVFSSALTVTVLKSIVALFT